MFYKLITKVLLITMVLLSFKFSTCEASSRAAAVTTISISSGVVIGGFALFFYLRNTKKNLASADSVISLIDSLWNVTNNAFYRAHYPEAEKNAHLILADWNRYFDALDKKKKRSTLQKDTLTSIIDYSKLYEKQRPALETLAKRLSTLPTDQDQLLAWNRHSLNAILDTIKFISDDSIARYRNENANIVSIYRPVTTALQRIDSLILSIYDNERQNFAVKNRYYYNRMLEQKNPVALVQFVDDCNYYSIDKEWCERARLQLDPHTAPVVEQPISKKASPEKSRLVPLKKPTAIDSMNELYSSAMASRSIELLEQYVKKYSGKKYKSKLQIDSARIVLESTRKELFAEQQFSREHAQISESPEKITITIRGVTIDVENEFKRIIDTLASDFTSLSALRLPATLSIDYSSTPPLYLLSGYIHRTKDIVVSDSLQQRRFTIQGARQGLAVLDKIARRCSQVLYRSSGTIATTPSYAVRLIKNGETYLTMYGYGNQTSGIDLYDFYDLSIHDHANIRTTYTPINYDIVISEHGDSLHAAAGKVFFGK